MAFEKLLADVELFSKLPNIPGSTGMTPEELKAYFDRAPAIIKDYINNVLYPEIGKTVDVDGAIEDALDGTLTSLTSPAQAKAVGEALRGLFTEAVHGGDYVLQSGESFDYTQNGLRMLHIGSGKAVMLGNLVQMAAGDVELSPAASGMYRNDLVVLRWSRSADGEVTKAFAVVAGTETSGTPQDPAVSRGNINDSGAVARELPLYRALFNGAALQSVTALFYPEVPVSFLQFRNVTVPPSAFQEYTAYENVGVSLRAAVPLCGVTAGMYPEVTFGVSDALGGTMAGVAETYDGGVFLFASGMPEADVVIPLITVRKDVGG